MSEVETIFYYIRNAFAHGSFDVTKSKAEIVYHLESRNKESIKAQMRLKETTLIRLMEIAKMSATEIKTIQKSRR